MLKKRIIFSLTFKDGILFRTKKFIPDYRYTKKYAGNFFWAQDPVINHVIPPPSQTLLSLGQCGHCICISALLEQFESSHDHLLIVLCSLCDLRHSPPAHPSVPHSSNTYYRVDCDDLRSYRGCMPCVIQVYIGPLETLMQSPEAKEQNLSQIYGCSLCSTAAAAPFSLDSATPSHI